MIQNWLFCHGERLFLLEYIQSDKNYVADKPLILLISGFGESICDSDYFMCKLARYLYSHDFEVVQAEMYGHGDSSGTLESLSMNKIEESLFSVLQYMKDMYGKEPLVISRGVIGTLISGLLSQRLIHRNICINPYYPQVSICHLLSDQLKIGVITPEQLDRGRDVHFHANDEVKVLVSILAESGVLCGRNVSISFVYELLAFDLYAALQNCHCLQTDPDKTSIENWCVSDGYRMALDCDMISLVEDPLWQFRAFNTLLAILNGG